MGRGGFVLSLLCRYVENQVVGRSSLRPKRNAAPGNPPTVRSPDPHAAYQPTRYTLQRHASECDRAAASHPKESLVTAGYRAS
jgi:hypothetical protein